MQLSLKLVYRLLYSRFGPQYWWPAQSPFEVIVGAILTQNTNWSNVEKAIANLKKNRALSPLKLHRMSAKKLAGLIRPAGYYNIKAGRIKNFMTFFFDGFDGKISGLAAVDQESLREKLLSVKGIGPETADSILLYAIGKPVFVVDAYTKRICSRHNLCEEDVQYEDLKKIFMKNLKNDVRLFNEFHALLVKLAKEHCLKNKPACGGCPLLGLSFHTGR